MNLKNSSEKLLMELKESGIKDQRVLNALKQVKREDFLPSKDYFRAYEDIALPIGYGATISQPYIVAYMLEQLDLKPGQKVLEIGTGSGYNAALISHLVGSKGKLYTTEAIPKLAEKAKTKLKKFKNIEVISTTNLRSNHAPFDRIIQTAASEKPQKELIEQLKINGIYLAPIGSKETYQILKKIIKTQEKLKIENLIGVRFIPLIHSSSL